MKKLFEKYNNAETLLVITSYPNPKGGRYGRREFNAVGEHSERRLPYIARTRRVVVLAENIGTKKYFSPIQNMLVARLWKKGNIGSFFAMCLTLIRLHKARSVLVQFEFNVWGGILPSLALLAVLAILRLFGKQITFEMHQVTTDIAALKKHVNITNPLAQFVCNSGLKIYYRMTGLIAHNVIVFEQELKNRLQHFVREEKIHILSLSVDKQRVAPSKKARKELKLKKDEFVLMVFGYINGYKGIDWIMRALKDVKHNNIRLLIAGGENPYLKDKPHYQKFYRSITDYAAKHDHITHTGFIPDEKVYLYYSASDLVIMPYEVFMSASGPFSRVLAHRKPVILSHVLQEYAKSHDFAEALRHSNLQKSDLFFRLEKHDLLRLITKAKHSKEYYGKLLEFSATLGELRSAEHINTRLSTILFPPAHAEQLAPDASLALQ